MRTPDVQRSRYLDLRHRQISVQISSTKKYNNVKKYKNFQTSTEKSTSAKIGKLDLHCHTGLQPEWCHTDLHPSHTTATAACNQSHARTSLVGPQADAAAFPSQAGAAPPCAPSRPLPQRSGPRPLNTYSGLHNTRTNVFSVYVFVQLYTCMVELTEYTIQVYNNCAHQHCMVRFIRA